MNSTNHTLLTQIIDQQIFAVSGSALATQIGYSRAGIQRALNGTVKESTLQKILESICKIYRISHTALEEIEEIVSKGKLLYRLIMEHECAKPGDTVFADQMLLAFVTLNYSIFSPSFRQEIIPVLKDIHRDTPNIYFGIIAMAYLKINKINPYIGNFYSQAKNTLLHIYKLLQEKCPENMVGKRAALAYTSNCNINRLRPCLWGLLENVMNMLYFYSDPDYVNTGLDLGVLFSEWGETSYWHQVGIPYAQGEKVWSFVVRESYSDFHGMYIGQEFEAGKDTCTFIPGRNFTLLFIEEEGLDENRILVSFFDENEIEEEAHINYWGTYDYDSQTETLTLYWDDEEENLLQLPHRLKRIVANKDSLPAEKVWANIIRKFDESDSNEQFSQSLLKVLKTEYLDDRYEIQNASISWEYFALQIYTEKGNICYKIPVSHYEFLRKITVFQEMIIKRATDEDRLYVEWPWLGYHIPLDEFETESPDSSYDSE